MMVLQLGVTLLIVIIVLLVVSMRLDYGALELLHERE